MATGWVAECLEDGIHHFVFHRNDYIQLISIKIEMLRISF